MKKFFTAIILSFTSLLIQAQVTANNELKSLITQSFGYFPKVREVENTVKTSEERLALVKINKLPEVTGDAGYAYVKPKITIPFPAGPGGSLVDFQFAPVHAMDAMINANYTLFDFGRIEANVQKAKDDIQYAKHNVDNSKIQLANQVTQIYYNIVYLKKGITIQDSVIQFLNDNLKLVSTKLKDGDALKIDLLNIQTQINEEQNRKVDLQNILERQLILLEYTTGVRQQSILNFDFDVNLADADAALATAKANNIDFVLAKDRIKQAESEVAIAKTIDKPVVGLRAATGYKNGYVPEVTNLRFNYQAGIGLSIPIYTGGKSKQQIKVAETLVKQNQLAVESLSSNYKKDIEQTLSDIQSNMERIKYTQQQINEAKYAQQLAATRFKNGVGTNLELTTAAATTQRIELMELRYQFQLCLSKVDLARLMGYTYW